MVYHIASYAGLNESVANSQILTAMPRKWQIISKSEARRKKLLMLQKWKYLKHERNCSKAKKKKEEKQRNSLAIRTPSVQRKLKQSWKALLMLTVQ
jgi:hypothetical protein